MEVQIFIRTVYGKPTIYPANETAALLLELTGKSTFSKGDIGTIEALGYQVTVQPDPRHLSALV